MENVKQITINYNEDTIVLGDLFDKNSLEIRVDEIHQVEQILLELLNYLNVSNTVLDKVDEDFHTTIGVW